MKKTIPVIHQLARTGGTIIGRCIGSMRGVTLLSEINPRGTDVARVFDPIYQGEHWFKLLSPDQADDLRERDAGFKEVVNALYDEAEKRGNQLVIRDWSHIDYLDWPVPGATKELGLLQELQSDFDVRSICVVRHPLVQWLSWHRYRPDQSISVAVFLDAYLSFAERAIEMGFVRYEDFSKDPDTILNVICRSVGIEFDPQYKKNWQGYMPITGDDIVFDAEGEIEVRKSQTLPGALLKHFLNHEKYFHAAELFSYLPFGELPDERARKQYFLTTSEAELLRVNMARKPDLPIVSQSLKKSAEQTRHPAVEYEEKQQITVNALKALPENQGRVFLIDPSVKDRHGHHYFLAAALLAEVTNLKKECIVIANSQISEEISDLEAFGYFGMTGYNSRPGSDEAVNYQISISENNLLSESLGKLPKSSFSPDDFVFFPTVTANQILAIISWILSFAAEQRPKFGICLMFPPSWHPALHTSESNERIFSSAFALLGDPSLAKSIVFTAETEGLSERYLRDFGVSALALPVPTIQLPSDHSAASVAENGSELAVVISCIGHARDEKGTHFMPRIHKHLTDAGINFSLIVQVVGHDPAYLQPIIDGLRDQQNVKLIYNQLEMPDVVKLIAETDIMLLPYNNRAYSNRGSTLFNEAGLVGVPVVVPSKTDIGREAESLNVGVTFDDWNADDIAGAIAQAVTRLPALKESAKLVQQAHLTSGGYLEKIVKRFDELQDINT